jgi:hypothetical protein
METSMTTESPVQQGTPNGGGVQRLAVTAPEAARSPDRLDPVHLVGFGDRRKAQNAWRGTESSNPSPSTGESANFQSLSVMTPSRGCCNRGRRDPGQGRRPDCRDVSSALVWRTYQAGIPHRSAWCQSRRDAGGIRRAERGSARLGAEPPVL